MRLMFLFLAAFLLTAAHPVHVSVTEVNYDEKDRALEVTSRVFVDDLEIAMRKRLNQPDLDILNPKGQTLDDMMRAYLTSQMIISLDGRRQQLNYLGHEREGDAFVFYIEVPKIKKWRTIAIANRVLTEIYEDQSNLVHITVRGKVKSMRLNRDNPDDAVSFD